MNFNPPTTYDEMMMTIKAIFVYYRGKREVYVEEEVEKLELERLIFLPLTETELAQKATVLLKPSFIERTDRLKQEITKKITSLTAEIQALKLKENLLIEEVEKAYIATNEKLRETYIKNGTATSGIYGVKISENVQKQKEEILDIKTSIQEKICLLEQEILSLRTELENADKRYEELEANEIEKKVIELSDEQEKYLAEVQKYNNSLEEKEVKYRNSLVKLSADLKFKYASLASTELSKTQLIDYGYYKNVLTCADQYYSTLSPQVAYESISNNAELMTYLDDFYETFLRAYKLKYLE